MQIRLVAPIALILVGADRLHERVRRGSVEQPEHDTADIGGDQCAEHAHVEPSQQPHRRHTGPNVRPGEKPPMLTAAARRNDNRGQIEFATYWIKTLDWAYATMDSTLARQTFDPVCTDCDRLLNLDIDKLRGKREHFRGGRIGVIGTSIQPNDGSNGATAEVETTILQAAFKIVNAAGKTVERTPATGSVNFVVWMQWANHKWTVVNWKRVVQK